MKKTIMKKNRALKQLPKLTLLASTMLMTTVAPVEAANWLMLQGTEKPNQAPRAKVWGFIQAEYQKTADTKLKAGPFAGKHAAFNQIGPQLTSAETFNVKRARIGVRGANFPLDKNVNYFLLAEFGNNGITTGKGASQGQLTDASITFNHIPGARIRVGQFKTPMSEEGYQGIMVFNYLNFTSGADRLLLERYFDNADYVDTGRNGPVGAFRDQGIQVFDTFLKGDWELSYSLMVGNGNGIGRTDNNADKDKYIYLSAEKLLGGGKGPWRHGMKFYAWKQDGKRTIKVGGTPEKFDRTRQGVGMTYFDGKYRAAAEYYTADGMIFAGTKGAGLPADGAQFLVQTNQAATAYYIDLGYRVKPNIELNYRYDTLDSGTRDGHAGNIATRLNKADERIFTNHTFGLQYFANRKTIIRANYEVRDIQAPHNPNAQKVVDAIDNRIGLQATVIY